MGSGRATTVPPARNVAWMVVTRARLRGAEDPDVHPGADAARRSAAAIPRASSCSRVHSTRSTGPASPAAAPTKVTVPRPVAAVSRRDTMESITESDSRRRAAGYSAVAPHVSQ